MTKPEIALTRSIYQPAMDALAEQYILHRLWLSTDPLKTLRELGPRVRALVTPGITGFSRAQVKALPNPETIARFGSTTTPVLPPRPRPGTPRIQNFGVDQIARRRR